jgi:hypothetical protein
MKRLLPFSIKSRFFPFITWEYKYLKKRKHNCALGLYYGCDTLLLLF